MWPQLQTTMQTEWLLWWKATNWTEHWGYGNNEMQRKLVEEKAPKRRKEKQTRNRKKTRNYHLSLNNNNNNNNNNIVRVCQEMFLHTLAISSTFVYISLQKKNDDGKKWKIWQREAYCSLEKDEKYQPSTSLEVCNAHQTSWESDGVPYPMHIDGSNPRGILHSDGWSPHSIQLSQALFSFLTHNGGRRLFSRLSYKLERWEERKIRDMKFILLKHSFYKYYLLLNKWKNFQKVAKYWRIDKVGN